VEQHPDKTLVGRIERGFTFLGYWITEKGDRRCAFGLRRISGTDSRPSRTILAQISNLNSTNEPSGVRRHLRKVGTVSEKSIRGNKRGASDGQRTSRRHAEASLGAAVVINFLCRA
jgi:hypothetical protein